jgi:hypothetical protein
MAYIYPKFSKNEFIGVRLGGAGLGNLLFTWSRVIAASEKYDLKLIWPTWPSIKIGTWIRHERDKRSYIGLFSNKTGMCGGVEKYTRLCFGRKIHTRNLNDIDWNSLGENDIVIYDDFKLAPGEFQMNFEGTREYRERISDVIFNSLDKKEKKALSFKASNAISVHVRLGDFSETTEELDNGKNNMRIQINWYVSVVKKLREAAGWIVPVYVFSDGTDEELSELTALPEVKRITFGNSIGDIVGLSRFPIMISSGSSFSLWARFLGNCSSISYPNQIKDRVHTGDGFEIELGLDDEFTEEQTAYIKEIYRKAN